MTELYKRRYRLNVAGTEITNHNIDFNVLKSTDSTPNRLEATVFNLGPDTIGTLQRLPKHAPVSLEAGYEDSISRIFRGDLRSVLTLKQSEVDVATTIEASDGSRVVRKKFNRSYGKGTRVEKVIEDLAESLDIDIGNLRSAIRNANLENNTAVYQFGTVLSGDSYDQLIVLLRACGFEVSIQDGALQVLRLKDPLSSTAVLLREDTGLLQGASIDNKQILSCSTLMIPDLFPGRKVRVESSNLRGTFKVTKCEYRGSNYSNDWSIQIEGRPVA